MSKLSNNILFLPLNNQNLKNPLHSLLTENLLLNYDVLVPLFSYLPISKSQVNNY